MKTAETQKPAPSKKTKRDLFTLSNESLEMVTGGQGVIVNGPK